MRSNTVKIKFALLILCLTLPSCISYRIAEKEIFYPRKTTKLNDGVGLEEVSIMTSDSIKLSAWFIKQPHPRGTILYFGGNGFLLFSNYALNVINTLSQFDMNLLLIDYRGYGGSEGTPTLNGMYEDGRSAYKYLCSRPDVDTSRIIIYGHSIGTLVAAKTGCSQSPAGVILEGVLSNALDMKDAVQSKLPWYLRWFLRLDADSSVLAIDNIQQVQHLAKPLLIVVGENDDLTPPGMGQKVYNAAASSQKRIEVIPKGEHSDLYFTDDGRREMYLKVVSKFLNDILPVKL
jgi:dipeptidyl aminopeptidase/acylaminoacyl peptidase